MIAGVEPDRPEVDLRVEDEEFAHCSWDLPDDNGFPILGYYVSFRSR